MTWLSHRRQLTMCCPPGALTRLYKEHVVPAPAALPPPQVEAYGLEKALLVPLLALLLIKPVTLWKGQSQNRQPPVTWPPRWFVTTALVRVSLRPRLVRHASRLVATCSVLTHVPEAQGTVRVMYMLQVLVTVQEMYMPEVLGTVQAMYMLEVQGEIQTMYMPEV